jgi:hypothetical protein
MRAGTESALYLALGVAVAALTACAPLTARAAAFPYTNDFSGSGANTDLPNESNTNWTVSGGTYNTAESGITGQLTTSASVQVTRPTSTTNFVQSTQFRVNSANGAFDFFTVGFAALSSVAAPYGGTNYLADFDFADNDTAIGRLRIIDQNGGTNTTLINNNDAVAPSAIALNTTYTLRLTGTYAGSNLTLTLGVFDAAGTTPIGTPVMATDSTPYAGTHFGYRDAAARTGSSGTVNYNVSFDNFQVVPEPATGAAAALLGAFAAATLCGRGRRRRPSGR